MPNSQRHRCSYKSLPLHFKLAFFSPSLYSVWSYIFFREVNRLEVFVCVCLCVCVCVCVCDVWQNTKSTSHQGWKDQLSFYLVCDILRWLVLKLSWFLPRFCSVHLVMQWTMKVSPSPLFSQRARRNWADHPQYILLICSPPTKMCCCGLNKRHGAVDARVPPKWA